jgi:hypothetical protein
MMIAQVIESDDGEHDPTGNGVPTAPAAPAGADAVPAHLSRVVISRTEKKDVAPEVNFDVGLVLAVPPETDSVMMQFTFAVNILGVWRVMG